MKTDAVAIFSEKYDLDEFAKERFFRHLYDFAYNTSTFSNDEFVELAKELIEYTFSCGEGFFFTHALFVERLNSSKENSFVFMSYDYPRDSILINDLYLDKIRENKINKVSFISTIFHEFTHYLQYFLSDNIDTELFKKQDVQTRSRWRKDVSKFFVEREKKYLSLDAFLDTVRKFYSTEEIRELKNNIVYRYFLIREWNSLSNKSKNHEIKKCWTDKNGNPITIEKMREVFFWEKNLIDKFLSGKILKDNMDKQELFIVEKYEKFLDRYSESDKVMKFINHCNYSYFGSEEDARLESIKKTNLSIEKLEQESLQKPLVDFVSNDIKNYLIELKKNEKITRDVKYTIVDAVLAQMRDIERRTGKKY